MEGDYVVVLAAQGALVRRVVRDDGGVVFIASPPEFERRQQGLDALDPVGFPRDVVFAYDGAAKAMLDSGHFLPANATGY